MRYGLPYQGSKNQIAEDICAFLPEGERLVDLFGGGGAITHCAAQSYKWKKVLYNELNTAVFNTFKDVVTGKLNNEFTHPRWVSRDEFNAKKKTDGFISLVWSFSNNMTNYLHGRDIEEKKHSIFEWVVNNVKDDFVMRYFPYETLESDTWQERYREYLSIVRNLDVQPFSAPSVETIARLKAIQSIRNIARIQSVERISGLNEMANDDTSIIEFSNLSYEQYEHRGGGCGVLRYTIRRN